MIKSIQSITLALLIATAAVFTTGCSIATTVHFNRNYSGTYNMAFDMSSLMGMAMMMDSTSDASSGDMMAEMGMAFDEFGVEDALNAMDGVSDAKIEVSDAGVLTMAYAFDNVESFNASFTKLEEYMKKKSAEMGEANGEAMSGLNAQEYTRQGKTISHRASFNSDLLMGMGDGMMGGDSEDMMGMSSMIAFTLEMTFDRKVKDLEVSAMDIVSQGDHVIKTRIDLEKMMEAGEYSISVRLK